MYSVLLLLTFILPVGSQDLYASGPAYGSQVNTDPAGVYRYGNKDLYASGPAYGSQVNTDAAGVYRYGNTGPTEAEKEQLSQALVDGLAGQMEEAWLARDVSYRV